MADANAVRTEGPSVFERARDKVSIQDFVEKRGVKLRKQGDQLRGACILCESGTTKFMIRGDRWWCFGEGVGGDIIELAARHQNLTSYHAACWLVDENPRSERTTFRAKAKAAPAGPTSSERVAAEILAAARPIAGTLAERYLIGRGIDPEIVAVAGDRLGYCGLAKHHWDEATEAWVRAPAVVAPVVVAGDGGAPVRTGGVHVTYLDRGGGKAKLSPAKRMWGPQGLDGKPGGAWLIGPDGTCGHWGPLAIGEGIETVLSLATWLRRRGVYVRAAAALSLDRLQGGLLRDADGCFDPGDVQGDPERPAFTWPQFPGAFWDEVLVAVDADMSEVKARIRTGRGKPVDVRLSADDRARICGRLATAAWKAAGAPQARALSPGRGWDFNDRIQAEGAA